MRYWIERDGCPYRRQSGKLAVMLSEVLPWRRDADLKRRSDDEAPDEARERARKLSAEADLAELKVRERRGELVAVEEAVRTHDRMCSLIRARVLGMRGKWAPRMLGLGTMPEATAVLDAVAQDILAALQEGADELEGETLEEAA